MRRVKTPVTLDEARSRLIAYRDAYADRHALYKAAVLAEIIWPDVRFIAAQGAGAAASRVLKKLGAQWRIDEGGDWGWRLSSL